MNPQQPAEQTEHHTGYNTEHCGDSVRNNSEDKQKIQAEDRFRLMADHAPVLLWTSRVDDRSSSGGGNSSDGGYDWFNATWLAFTGCTLEQAVGDRWLDGVHPDDVHQCQDTYRDACANRQAFTRKYRLRRYDGLYRWLLDNATPLFAADGAFTGYIGSCTDISEQQRLVAELAAANVRQRDSLQQSEERFRLLVEGVQDYAIFMLDPQGHVVTWNAGAARFKGYAASEIIGEHFSRFYTEEDIARGHPQEELEIATREGRYEEEGWRVRKDGTRFWANVVITALRDESDTLRGFAKVTRDVTERRLRDQERAIAQALEQQRRFLKDVLQSVTQGRLRLCDTPGELPPALAAEPIGAPIALSARTLKAVRSRVDEAATTSGLPRERAQDLVTAVSECAMNAIQHAGGGTATVFADAGAGRVQVWFADEGRGIDLSNLPRATLEAGFSTGGGGIGHGFSLMIACCERVYLLTGPRGTTIVLEQARLSPEPSWLQGR